MKPETQELVRHRVERANETMEVARWALDNDHLIDAVNRLYYACFYAVSALLLAEGLSSSKHTGVLSLFIRHWTNTGRLPVELSRFYKDLFKHRQQGDYHDLVIFQHDEVEAWFEEAAAFVARISEEIEKMLQSGQPG